MKRVGENPPQRWPNDAPLEVAGPPWWIAKVKPRQEKALADDFIRREIEYYLPLYTKVVRRKDNNKPRKSVLPLFSGYISFRAAKGGQQSIFSTGRVVSVLEVRHQKRFVEELNQIYGSLSGGFSLEPLETYQPGQLVKVKSGPLRGIIGTVIQIQNQSRLVLEVEGLGRAAMVVDAAMVKVIAEENTGDR
jgi:transcription antitermination factor NusG